MKKHGFTLAEVLVTMGIIGVISALVMPTFTSSVQNRKVGPKLAKAVASFEQAAQATLADREADSFTDSGDENFADIFDRVSTHLKGARDGVNFISADGTAYILVDNTRHMNGSTPYNNVAVQRIDIDIDGLTAGADMLGQDRFAFYLSDDGSLTPYGSRRARNLDGIQNPPLWTDLCGTNTTVTSLNARMCCAAHVLENNLRVEYKLGHINPVNPGTSVPVNPPAD